MRASLAIPVFVVAVLASPALMGQPVTLVDAARDAAQHDEQVRIAAELVNAADARRREARGAIRPTVTASTTITRNDRDVSVGGRTVAHLWDTAAQAALRVTLFDASAFPALGSATRAVASADANAAASRVAVRAAAARLYVDAVASRTRLDLAREAIVAAHATRDRVRARHDAGYALDTELDQAELAVLRAESDALNAEIALDDALAALAFVMVRDDLTADQLVDPVLPRAPGAAPARPEFEALDAELAAARLALRAARWTLAPTVALTGRYDIGRESLRAPDGRSWTLALTFSWDLYDPARYPRMDAAEAAASVASIERDRLARELDEARDVAVRRIDQAEARHALATRTADVAASAHALMRERFELGDATLLEMTEADAALATARLDAALARLDADRARIDLLVLNGAFDDDAPDMEAP